MKKETAIKRAMTLVTVLAMLAVLVSTIGTRPARMAVSLTPPTTGARVDPLLTNYLSAKAPGTKTSAVISYGSQPSAANFAALQSVGITRGYVCQQPPMIISDMNLAQLACGIGRQLVVT